MTTNFSLKIMKIKQINSYKIFKKRFYEILRSNQKNWVSDEEFNSDLKLDFFETLKILRMSMFLKL